MSLTTTAPSDPRAYSHARSVDLRRRHGAWRHGHATAVRLIDLLQQRPHTQAELAAQLEVSTRTVRRVLVFLRDDLGLPVSEGSQPGQLTRNVHLLRPVHLCPLCLREIAR